jgi:hypothetical protein
MVADAWNTDFQSLGVFDDLRPENGVAETRQTKTSRAIIEIQSILLAIYPVSII